MNLAVKIFGIALIGASLIIFSNFAFAQNQTINLTESINAKSTTGQDVTPTIREKITDVKQNLEELSSQVDQMDKNVEEILDKIESAGTAESVSPNKVIELIGKILDFVNGITSTKVQINAQIDSLIDEINLVDDPQKANELTKELEQVKTQIQLITIPEQIDQGKLQQIIDKLSDSEYGLEEIKREIRIIELKTKESSLIIEKILGILDEQFGQKEPDTSTKIYVQTKKITITNELSFMPVTDHRFSFYIKNIGENTAKDIQFIPSKLLIKGDPNFGSPDSSINHELISINPNNTTITIGESKEFTLNIAKSIHDEAVYEGKIYIKGENIDASTLDVELKTIMNPYLLLIFNIIGISVAVSTGYLLTRNEKQQEHTNKINDDKQIVDHINNHIKEINKLKHLTTEMEWKSIKSLFYDKYLTVQNSIEKLSLSEDMEEVKWFENISKILQEKIRNSNIDNDTYPHSAQEINSRVFQFFEDIIVWHRAKIKRQLIGLDTSDSKTEKMKEYTEELTERLELLDTLALEYEKTTGKKKEHLPHIKTHHTDKLKRITTMEKYWREPNHKLITNWLKNHLKLLNEIHNQTENEELVDREEIEQILEKHNKIYRQLIEDKKTFMQHVTEIKHEKAEIDEDEQNYQTIKEKRIKEKIDADMHDRKKWIFVGSAIIISIPVHILVADSFTGSVVANLVVSGTTGFGIYRIKNIRDLFNRS